MGKERQVEQLSAELGRAYQKQQLVRVTRSIAGADQVDGYVVALGRRWVLLASTSDAHPDGWTALRLRDLVDIRRAPSSRLTRFGFQQAGLWPPLPPPVRFDLDDTEKFAAGLAEAQIVTSVHVEKLDPDVCYIGLVDTSERGLELDEIDTRGRWTGRRRYRRGDVTRIGVGDRYSTLLAGLAAGPPSRTGRRKRAQR